MNENPRSHDYRNIFMVAVALNIVLALGLGILWWRSHRQDSYERAAMPQPAAPASATFGSSSMADAGSTGDSTMNRTDEAEPPLAPIQLTPQRMQSIGVKLGTAEYKNIHDQIRASGNVEMDERRLSYVQVRFPGWIRKVFADATYQYVRKGQPLFTIYSPDLVTTEQEYLLAKKNAEQLRSSSVSGVASGAESLVSAAKQRLQQWEVPQSEIAKLESTGKSITALTFNSSVSGYITEKNVLPNMYVQPQTKLYTVADLSTIWVYAQIFQSDIGKLKPGDTAQITVDAYPGKNFTGRVDQILPQVDMNTRTVRLRLVLQNPGLKLKPGMYVNVLLQAPMGRQLVVPASAVLHTGNRQLVFINHGEGNLEPREVETGARVGDDLIVIKGLKAGESLVTSANFLIDSESQLQAAAGAFLPPPPGAGQAAAMNAPVEFSSQPSPPRKGSNLFRVKLTGKNGLAISGAQVTITFYMPAMAAMGMAAMRTPVTLTDKGNAVYEGTGDLSSGGTWQVTITAMKDGRTLASKRLTINAQGGM